MPLPLLSPPPVPQYNSQFDVVVSGDRSGMLEYWGGAQQSYGFPRNVRFDHKIDTDLYEFVRVSGISFSVNLSLCEVDYFQPEMSCMIELTNENLPVTYREL